MRNTVIKELAHLKFKFVANTNIAPFARVVAALFVVGQIVDHIHGAVIVILGHCANAAIKPTIFRFSIVQFKLGFHVHAHHAATLGNVIHNFNFSGAMFPVETQEMIVSLKLIFFRVTVATTVRNAGYQCIAAIKLNRTFKHSR